MTTIKAIDYIEDQQAQIENIATDILEEIYESKSDELIKIVEPKIQEITDLCADIKKNIDDANADIEKEIDDAKDSAFDDGLEEGKNERLDGLKIHGTSIIWEAENFTDQELMSNLNECLFRGIDRTIIRDLLYDLYRTK